MNEVTVGPMDGAGASTAERYLDVDRVAKQFGSSVVLKDLVLSVARSEFVSLLGPSGCGKTTLLRLIAGLQSPDTGRILIDGRDITRTAAHKRNIGVVFQNYALFPHLSVEQNVAFGLVAQRQPEADIKERVANALALVRMQEFSNRRISALSGGQQQRVAVARAIVVKPTLLLLDEPFSALDRKLRETMQIEMRHLLRELRITSIFVTHDQDEALVMSDRIAVMNNGCIEQLGTPTDVYGQPSTLHVLEFVGQSTRLTGQVLSPGGSGNGHTAVETPLGTIRVPQRGQEPLFGRVIVGVRPESMTLGEGSGDCNRVRARLTDIVFFGAKTTLHFASPGADDRLQAEVSRVPETLAPGTEVSLNWPVRETMVYPAP